VAFAGSEAIVAYHQLPKPSENAYTGGLLVNNGSGWEVDQGAAAAIGSNVPWAVAGLPDGGAAFAAGERSGSGAGGAVFERSGAGAPWQQTATPLPGAAEPGSLALFREAGALRVIASGSVPNTYQLENVPSPPPGFPPNLVQPYPLSAGYGAGAVIRQTAGGWLDEEHERNSVQDPPGNYKFYDTVYQPDPVSAVLVDPTGAQGWAVGGFVDAEGGGVLDTADVDRYPPDGVAPPGVNGSSIPVESKQATFAIGGGAQCSAPCADRANAKIGPDVWLTAALQRAGQIQGVRAFLYTGPRVTTGETAGPATLVVPYARELERYAGILAAGPSIRAFAAASPTDLDGVRSESAFEQSFAGFPQPFGGAPPALEQGLSPAGRSSEPCAGTPGCSLAYYSFDSSGPAGTVRAIVLDDSTDVGSTQLAWLASQLKEAAQRAEPAIAIGNADLNAQLGAGDPAAGAVAQTLISGGASAYFYDSPEQNVELPLRIGAASIPTFGSGTLGYIHHVAESRGDFLGASGFLLGQVDVAARDPSTNRAPVSARLIPNIGELELEARSGTLLRRSQVALFNALARRVRAGDRSQNQANSPDTDPYIPIPSNCVGVACADGLFPEYTFSSSRPDIGDFVAPNLASAIPNAVLLGSNEKPIPDPQSGLFCAYNAGTTIVTISAGGLSSSLPVTVQGGSVRRPCGTVPLKELPTQSQQAPVPPPPPPPGPAPAGPAPASAPPPVVPLPPPPAILAPPAPARPSSPPPFLLPAAPAAALLAAVPPPLPTPARPTPPSGTSAVTSPVEAPQREEEEEEATESVSNQAVAYRAPEHEPTAAYVLGATLLAAFAGASVRRRPRGGRRDLRVAPATLSTTRAQRRMSGRR
jgi:hypothetical protein